MASPRLLLLLLLCGALLGAAPAGAQAPELPAVRAVLFWMEGCPHCHTVITEVLPPLQEKYGAQLDLRLIELFTLEDVNQLYELGAAYGLPRAQVGVPLLVLGEQALSGGQQIPDELPRLIEAALAAGGVDFPDIQPFALAQAVPLAEVRPLPPLSPSESGETGLPEGAWAAAGALAVLGAALVYTPAALYWKKLPAPPERWTAVLLPLLALAGLGVAGYLAYVETQAVPALCGPVGDCNAVQASPYARLFGWLPVGVLGVLGYLAILAAFAWSRLRHDRLARLARGVLLGMALAGVLFSLYLTTLELFVIRAVCLWCVSSALIMALLLLLAINLVKPD